MGAVAKYCDEYVHVCASVCLSVREDISSTTHANFIKFFVRVAYGRDSGVVVICTSSFVIEFY